MPRRRGFYGFVRAFTTPAQRSDDIAPLAGVMGQVAAGLISSPTYHTAPTMSRGVLIRLVLVKGSCGVTFAEPKQAPITCDSSPGTDRSGW